MNDSWPGSRKKREALSRLPIGEMVEWHLVATCMPCRAERNVMVRDLVARYGPKLTLAMIVPRLRCRTASCRKPPSLVVLQSKFRSAPGPDIIEVVLKEPGRT